MIAIPVNKEEFEKLYPNVDCKTCEHEVLTLRDQFAMAALQGIVSDPNRPPMNKEMVAKCAYMMADAMLKQREVGNERD